MVQQVDIPVTCSAEIQGSTLKDAQCHQLLHYNYQHVRFPSYYLTSVLHYYTDYQAKNQGKHVHQVKDWHMMFIYSMQCAIHLQRDTNLIFYHIKVLLDSALPRIMMAILHTFPLHRTSSQVKVLSVQVQTQLHWVHTDANGKNVRQIADTLCSFCVIILTCQSNHSRPYHFHYVVTGINLYLIKTCFRHMVVCLLRPTVTLYVHLAITFQTQLNNVHQLHHHDNLIS